MLVRFECIPCILNSYLRLINSGVVPDADREYVLRRILKLLSTVEYNLSLGEKRAQAAKTYLVTAGINADRIQTISYGKERPVDPGHNEAAWAKNRRCEFRIISQ